ncbi:MAG: histidine phosphatase family protein [Mariniblastus sp.]
MKRFCSKVTSLLVASLILTMAASASAQEAPNPKSTTWIVVRHADREGRKDELNEAGKIRAAKLVEIATLLRVTEIYSTDWVRTKTTAQPTAEKLKLEVQIYKKHDAEALNALKVKHAGAVVMIVGHSNTVGPIVNGLGGKGDFAVGHDDYDDLFIVTTDEKSTRAVRLKFGD